MRHVVSTNQLVLWPHHELTQAWAPTGILHPPQKGTEIGGQEVGEKDAEQDAQADEANRGIDAVSVLPDATVLTRNGGVCGQVGRVYRRHRGARRAGLAGSRRSAAAGLV
jgi:hypothetical protein